MWQSGKLADKVGTPFTPSQTVHGGHETTILALNNALLPMGGSLSTERLLTGRRYTV